MKFDSVEGAIESPFAKLDAGNTTPRSIAVKTKGEAPTT